MAEPEARSAQTRQDQNRAREAGAARRPAEDATFQAGAAPAEVARMGLEAFEGGADMWRRSMQPFGMMPAEMTRWFGDLWRQAMTTSWPAAGQATALAGAMGLPSADLRETDRDYQLCVELPGLKPQDVEIAVERDLLNLRGHKAEESDEAQGAWRVRERRFGRFERAFALPRDVDREAIEAEYRDGLLKITLPKRADAGGDRRRILVKDGSGARR